MQPIIPWPGSWSSRSGIWFTITRLRGSVWCTVSWRYPRDRLLGYFRHAAS